MSHADHRTKRMDVDVIVIGGGAAGTAAALAARASGARVRLIRRALGATALSSGAVDLAGDPSEAAGDPWEGRPTANQSFVKQARIAPDHPLARCRTTPREAERILKHLCDMLPLLHHRDLEQPPLILPTDLGTFKSTHLCQRTQADGHLPSLKGGRIGVVGIKGYSRYDCQLLARSFSHHAARGDVGLFAVGLELDLITQRGDELMHPTEMAQRLEQPAMLQRLIQELAGQSSANRLTALLLPPLMGLDGWQRVQTELARTIRVAEMLASPPSVPGLRLQRALDAALAQQGITLLTDQVSGCSAHTDQITAVTLSNGDSLEADAFVLATGRFIGQGLAQSDEGLQEPLFGLPVWIGRHGPNPRHLGKLMNREVTGPHLLMSAGIRVDQRLRPQAAWRNLFAAGSVIGGYDYILQRCGLGTALITGYLAGVAAAGGAL